MTWTALYPNRDISLFTNRCVRAVITACIQAWPLGASVKWTWPCRPRRQDVGVRVVRVAQNAPVDCPRCRAVDPSVASAVATISVNSGPITDAASMISSQLLVGHFGSYSGPAAPRCRSRAPSSRPSTCLRSSVPAHVRRQPALDDVQQVWCSPH